MSRVLIIAGSDSCAGAGVQADMQSVWSQGGDVATVVTAVTAQNPQGVSAIHEIPADIVLQQLQSVCTTYTFTAVKIGMLFSKTIIHVVKQAIDHFRLTNIIVDPVMVATSGSRLLADDAISTLQTIFPRALLITPNLPEAEYLLQSPVKDRETAAKQLSQQYQTNVLLKGGHGSNDEANDVLVIADTQRCHWFNSKKLHTENTHGTGCRLASLVAANFCKTADLITATAAAKQQLQQYLLSPLTECNSKSNPDCSTYSH